MINGFIITYNQYAYIDIKINSNIYLEKLNYDKHYLDLYIYIQDFINHFIFIFISLLLSFKTINIKILNCMYKFSIV